MKKASDIVWFVPTSAVIWSIVLISVTWVELHWSVYTFFRINNIDLKCSFVGWEKYFKSWWNGAAELHIAVDLLYFVAQRPLKLLPERWTLWKIQQTQIDSRPSANSWNMYALRRFRKLLKCKRFTKTELQTGSANVWKMNAKDTRITMWVSASKWGKT